MLQSPENRASRTTTGLLAAVGITAIGFRLAGIDYGLPLVFNGDEPHLVNVAVSFGGGSLNPGIFKYPTLWPYALFGSYGLYFLIWSGFGFLHTVGEFGSLFAWDPGRFTLIARLLSAALSVAALHRVYRCGSLLGRHAGLWAGAWLAVSPTLVMSAHAAKPDSMMFFLASWAWWFGLRHRETGRPADLVLCGTAAGLCASSQYVAAPLAILVPCAWAAAEKRAPRPALLWALAAVPAAFLAGTPFALLDAQAFLRDLNDVRAMAGVGVPNPPVVIMNLLRFSDPWCLGGAAAAAGLWLILRGRRSLGAVLAIPIAVHLAFLSFFPDGTWARFLIPVFPALTLTAAWAVERAVLAVKPSTAVRIGALLAVLAPGAKASWAFDADLLLPDTRNIATVWIRENLPAGARLLTFSEHASPATPPSLSHVRALLAKARETGHPRARYYAMMEAGHPGGGFAVFRISQDPAVLQAGARHVAWSAQGRAMLDVREGLAPAREAGIRFVVYSSYGSNDEGFKALEKFTSEVERSAELLREFRPRPGRERGPDIRVYRIPDAAERTLQ